MVQVRKSYEEKRKRRRERGERRPWKLQRMAVDQGDVVMKSKAERAEALRAEADLEHFMEVRPFPALFMPPWLRPHARVTCPLFSFSY